MATRLNGGADVPTNERHTYRSESDKEKRNELKYLTALNSDYETKRDKRYIFRHTNMKKLFHDT